MINVWPQGTNGNPSPATNRAHTKSSTSAGALTSGAQTSSSGTHYVCRDCVSRVNIKRLKYISHQFWLSEEVHQPPLDERPHLPPYGMMGYSESILREQLA